MPRQKICIMGAGVGGLTAAHELAMGNNSYDIYIIERNLNIGGQARSLELYEDGKIFKHTEYCWHAIHIGYFHFMTVLSGILDSTGTPLLRYLKPIRQFIYSGSGEQYIEHDNSFLTVFTKFMSGIYNLYGSLGESIFDVIQNIFSLALFFLNILFASNLRITHWDSIKWKDFLARYNFPKFITRWLLDSTSIFLGMDYQNLSTHTMAKLIRNLNYESNFLSPKYKFYSFTGPMSTILFNQWENHLVKAGVKIYKNTTVESIYICDNVIHKIECDSSVLNNNTFDKDTIFINAMSVESFATIINRPNIFELAQLGYQTQTQVFFKFSHPRTYNKHGTIIIHYESPWFLMSRIEETFWREDVTDGFACWSVGIGMWDVPGTNGKSAIECTPYELAKECWIQMNMDVKLNLGPWADDIYWDIWHSFQWDTDKKQLITWEPKWSNAVGALKLRPTAKDSVKNLYNATAYTLNNTITFNMEGAAEAGRYAAHLIKNPDKPFDTYIEVVPFWIKIIRYVDSLIFTYFK